MMGIKDFVNGLSSISKWYGGAIVLIYALLSAEYMSTINDFVMKGLGEVSGIVESLMQLGYIISIISALAAWVIMSLMFHIIALLFNGRQDFSKFLFVSSYLYFIPAIALVVAINMLGYLDVEESENVINNLMDNRRFILIMDIVNYSYLPFYLLTVCVIRYSYNIKWLYSFLSVVIPVASVWGVTELFKLL